MIPGGPLPESTCIMTCLQRTLKKKPAYKNIFSIASIIFAAAVLPHCRSGEIKKDARKNVDDKTVITSQNLQQTYAAYESLKGDFTVQGNISGKAFTYNGIISLVNKAGKDFTLSMVIRDMIFFSPLITIEIRGEKLNWKDHLNNREKTYEYSQSSILFFSNQNLPAQLLIPLVTGNLPEGMLERLKTAQGKKTLQYSLPQCQVVGFFEDSKLHTLVCNPEDTYQSIYKLSGSVENSMARHFPRNIKIIFADNEYVEIIYNKIQISPPLPAR